MEGLFKSANIYRRIKENILKIKTSKSKDSWRFFYGTIIKSYNTNKPTFVYFRIFEKQK